MSDLRDYLEKRRNSLRKEMEPLAKEASQLRSKLVAIDDTLKRLAQEVADIEKALHALGKRHKTETDITIKEAILKVLADHPEGLASSELVKAINDRYFGGTVARSSMSPQLFRLKKRDEKITQRGDRYFLA